MKNLLALFSFALFILAPSADAGITSFVKSAAAPYVNALSIDFDSADSDYISCPSVNYTTTMTVCVRAKDNTSVNGKALVSKYNANASERSWLINTLSNKAQVLMDDNGTTPLARDYQGTQTVFWTLGWNQFCFTIDTTSGAGVLNLYGNGTLDASPFKAADSSMAAGIKSSTSELLIAGIRSGGGGPNPAAFYNGNITNVSIWNIALDATGITNTRASSKPADLATHPNYSNLVHWYKLGDGDAVGTGTILGRRGSNHCTSVIVVSGDIVADVP